MQPAEVEQLSAELRDYLTRAWQALQDLIDAILDTWPEAPRNARRARLEELQAAVDDLIANVDGLALDLAQTGLTRAYELGSYAVNPGHVFTQIDTAAVGQLATATYDDILAATAKVGRTTKQLIRTLTRQHLGDKLLVGQTAEQAARELRRSLEANRIHAVTYKDGSRVGLPAYTSMLMRTTSAVAYSSGNIAATAAIGVGYVEALDGFGCKLAGHGTPGQPDVNGTVHSLAVAAANLTAHPNCVRSWSPRPDVTTDEEAENAAPSQTPEQIADQRQVSLDREAAGRRRASRKRKQAKRAERLAQRAG